MVGAEERRKKRDARKKLSNSNAEVTGDSESQANTAGNVKGCDESDNKIAKLLAKNEDDLLNFVVKVNKVYQEKLKRPPPFMTFVICGMQSAGKSTIMERFMNAVLNIIQEGTGTRCPLDTTCIHDPTLTEASCDLSGDELAPDMCGEGLSISDVFKAITAHNKHLASEDKFSTKELRLIYRASNVQNMRFVDTPGIISNKGQGKDNRKDIQDILRKTMKRPNTKLCVLLEAKEFSTNPIIDFCDETFNGREDWVYNSIFVMNKFDKQFGDARSGSKANNFFKEFHDNKIFPHLVMTPTLVKEDLPFEELFQKRQGLLNSATEQETDRFEQWLHEHDKFLQENPDDELLHQVTRKRIGFETTKNVMRMIMLEDTASRLPEVLKSLRSDLGGYQNTLRSLKEKERFNDPKEVKMVMGQLLQRVQRRIISYLDGDLETAVKLPHILQDLDDELDEEEDSEWSSRELNHFSDSEEDWRNMLSKLEYPDQIQAHKRFHGGKQIQRAIETFGLVLIDSLPDPFELKDFVANGAGYLQNGLQRENWERAITSIVQMTVKKTSHPGINFLIKHVGQIFRRMFGIALEDVKQRDEFSATLKLIPSNVETFLTGKFDEMLWKVMEDAANSSHEALAPMYSTLDPTLPTFSATYLEEDDERELFTVSNDGQYVKTPSKKDSVVTHMMSKIKEKALSLVDLDDGNKAKQLLAEQNKQKALEKNCFLPDKRTSMINDQETDLVIKTAFKYIIALMEFNMIILRFQINHYLYEGFKKNLDSWTRNVLMEDWEDLVKPDDDLADEINDIESKIIGLKDSLMEVQRMQSKF